MIGHGRSLFSTPLIGRGLSILNIGVMLGVFWAQTFSGALIGMFPLTSSGGYDIAAYRLVFAAQSLLAVLAIVAYLRAGRPNEK